MGGAIFRGQLDYTALVLGRTRGEHRELALFETEHASGETQVEKLQGAITAQPIPSIRAKLSTSK
jgi:hypothetical protein